MFHIAQDNIKTNQDRVHFYVDPTRQPSVFNPEQKVLLCVPHNYKTLSTFYNPQTH